MAHDTWFTGSKGTTQKTQSIRLLSTSDAQNYYPEPEGWGEDLRRRREMKARRRGVPLLHINVFGKNPRYTIDGTRIPEKLYFIEFTGRSTDQKYKKTYDAKAYQLKYRGFDYEKLDTKLKRGRRKRRLNQLRVGKLDKSITDFIHSEFSKFKGVGKNLGI